MTQEQDRDRARLAVAENDIADLDGDITRLYVALNILRERVSFLEIDRHRNLARIAELEHELGMDR